MRFVDHDVRAVRARDLDQLAQRRDVALDRIQPFGDDQAVALILREPLELLAQALG
jgi:hypothetical protein